MHDNFFDTARKAANLATQMCLSAVDKSLKSERKVDKTWVTEADQDIEQQLRKLISKAHPDHAILGEEFGGASELDPKRYTWILDPIDGTFSFVHGIPFYSSLIALFRGTEPVLGFACLPGMGIQMSALKGKGAFINDVPYVRPARTGAAQIEIIATADPYRFRMENKSQALDYLYAPERRARTYPDALGYYLLLNGSVRCFVDPKVEIWDVAPFHVILPEAGFAIHPWTQEKNLVRGTSVAYPLDEQNKPLGCGEILDFLKTC